MLYLNRETARAASVHTCPQRVRRIQSRLRLISNVTERITGEFPSVATLFPAPFSNVTIANVSRFSWQMLLFFCVLLSLWIIMLLHISDSFWPLSCISVYLVEVQFCKGLNSIELPCWVSRPLGKTLLLRQIWRANEHWGGLPIPQQELNLALVNHISCRQGQTALPHLIICYVFHFVIGPYEMPQGRQRKDIYLITNYVNIMLLIYIFAFDLKYDTLLKLSSEGHFTT